MRFGGLPLTGVALCWGLRASAAKRDHKTIDWIPPKRIGYAPRLINSYNNKMNEICYVLIGERRGNVWVGKLQERSEGEPTSVAFDWAKVLVREESFGDVLGFYHTHPMGAPLPSPRDVRTMQAWVHCFGKPLLCAIESGDILAGYLFDQDGHYKPVGRITRLRSNMLVAAE